MDRPFYFLVGWLALILGGIGLFLPILPTVPFLILAAFCFSKSSPKMRQWLMNQPRLGPLIQDWEKNRVIRRPTKIYATTLIVMGGSFSLWLLRDRSPYLQVFLIALLSVGIFTIWRQRSEVEI